MRFTETPLSGAYIIDWEPRADERGFFARNFCRKEMAALGLDAGIVQCNTSFTCRKGTIRGMHFQRPPMEEVKYVQCVQGSLFDVMVDLRSSSPSYGKWFGAELTCQSNRTICIPKGFAHGFQTLEDDTRILYYVTQYYDSSSDAGVRWDDPAFNISWPLPATCLSPKDRSFPLLADAR